LPVIAPPSAAGGGGWKQPFKIESGRGCFAGAPTAFKGCNITGKEGLAVGSVAADRASPEEYSDEGRGCGHAGDILYLIDNIHQLMTHWQCFFNGSFIDSEKKNNYGKFLRVIRH